MPEPDDRITVESITSPGHTQRLDRTKYMAMRATLPEGPPGIPVAEAKAALLPALPGDLFPGGAKAGWWLKAVQLDLEARGVIARGWAARCGCSGCGVRPRLRLRQFPLRVLAVWPENGEARGDAL